MKKQKEAKEELQVFIEQWAAKHEAPLQEAQKKAEYFIKEMRGTVGGSYGMLVRGLSTALKGEQR